MNCLSTLFQSEKKKQQTIVENILNAKETHGFSLCFLSYEILK